MPADPRAVVERIAQKLLGALAELTDPPTLRVAGASGRVAWLVQVWDSARVMPTAAGVGRGPGARAGCRADVLAAVRAADRPMSTKEVVRALRLARKSHGVGTVTKALADLTREGELTNPRDGRGYRPKGWERPATPSLF
jgi:hypothetical protein